MRIPALTMSRPNDPPRLLGRAPQRPAGAWRDGPDALLDQAPRGLDRIQIRRIGGQKAHRCTALFDEPAGSPIFVRSEIVEDHDVPGPQFRGESPRDPGDEAGRIGGLLAGLQRQPPIRPDRADHRQVIPPIHRPRVDHHGLPRDPRVRPAHRQIRARFIHKDEPRRIYLRGPLAERLALGLDLWAVLFRGPRTFFLNTYPVRRSARNTLDRWTRCARGTRRLYTRVKSSVVASGVSRTTACSTVSTTGEDHPPRLPRAATVPVARRRWTQRSSVQRFTENRSATVAYDAPPGSYARTARSRSSMG